MRVLAEIPSQASSAARVGTLRRCDLDAYGALLEELRGIGVVLVLGEPDRRRLVAVGLATAAAATGSRTALAECDLGEPVLADALGLAVAPGLHEYLRGEVEAESILDSLVLAGPGAVAAGEPLICLVAGRPASDGPALLASERFRHVVAKLRSAYELVVLAGPGEAGAALAAVASLADTALACVADGRQPLDLDVPLAGLVVVPG